MLKGSVTSAKKKKSVFLLQIYLEGIMTETHKHWNTLLVQLQCFSTFFQDVKILPVSNIKKII